MIPLYIDLDGVLRDLEWSVFGKRVSDWLTPVNGLEEFYSFMDRNLHILEQAEPAKHFHVFYNFFALTKRPINILTHQPVAWRDRTSKWIETHLDGICTNVIYVEDSKDKLKYLEDAVLIDDHPALNGNPRVLYFDKLYNKPPKDGQLRISKDEELESALFFIHDEDKTLKDWDNMVSEIKV